jgi:t-SNARE complex subunit (syntaxin)
VTKARSKVQKGHEELVQAKKLQNSGRKRNCFLLFLVLIILAVIVCLIKFS